ncbi:MAG TPA: hypothetical protein DEB09_02895 [Candidatus Magasanikbacteria bacterium]|nr:hypothetical protein [Candidatus Magasanikbacteria bacterium]
MSRSTLLTTGIIITFVLIISGCGQTSPTGKQSTSSTSTKQLIKKQPVMRDTRTDSYDFCENKNYEVIVRYDETTESSQIYCRFSDTTECLAEDFMNGKCAPGNGAKTFQNENGKTEAVVVCAQNYDPVCGEDKITYSNDCIASVNKVKVAFKGVCVETQATNDAVTNNTSTGTPTNFIKEKIKIPDWLELVTSFIQTESPKTPKTFIDQCQYGETVVYYESNGSPDYFSILYNQNGEVVCYPNNNLSKKCPDYFNAKDRSRNCTRIWTDGR